MDGNVSLSWNLVITIGLGVVGYLLRNAHGRIEQRLSRGEEAEEDHGKRIAYLEGLLERKE